ncbi:MAG: threonine/serine dehydratase [Pseudomonadota bacterium]
MTPELITAAETRLAGVVRRTPLLSSGFLDEIAGRPVYVKAECLQHTGSFKFRGAWSAISMLGPECGGVIAYSSGNHAQGVAMAAARRGLPAVIIMPDDAPEVKLANTRALGAEVVTYRRMHEDRDALGQRLAKERGLTLVKPFDDPLVIAGQATCGLEICAQAAEEGLTEADIVVCAGGGGLASGIALALEMRAPGFILRTAEPDGFDDMRRSLAAGEILRNGANGTSICDAILTPCPGTLTFPILNRCAAPGVAMPDAACLRAMRAAFERLRLVLEPGGAVALAAALWHPDLRATDAAEAKRPIIAVATGGNVDAAVFMRALAG